MAISVFDLFKIGIGPSSSHTVGPMRAARQFIARLEKDELLTQTASVRAEMFGSLGATGKGHGTDVAVLLGLQGEQPDLIDTDAVDGMLAAIRADKAVSLLGKQTVPFVEGEHLILHKKKTLPYHPNGMIFEAFDAAGASLSKRAYYSVGGGFVVDEAAIDAGFVPPGVTELKHPFKSAAELLALCQRHGKSISQIMLENELAWRSEEQVRAELLKIWQVMQDCVKRGCEREGILPGGMKVKRRAADMHHKLLASPEAALRDPLTVMDWVNLYALAVNEENAGGGRVVTAPTNGAAGIIPAVMHYYARFVPGASDDGIVRFLLTAGAIGVLFKLNASISGAEVGCQGEVGSACSMAAGALAEVLGGTPEQVENAAEIGMEHNLGLTCDPVGGLVQVPCIERNAMASVKAINAARMALRGDGQHFVSLDRVIKTMRDTGMDMSTKYKETARGGLAINVIEVPVNIVEC
ncbi:L-serine ammonia-lyase [Chromobacterium haemolyticum]|uniref:L-serine dehydratase n=1 Tax=Chromobacterium fluminis TaxID=3044269 RepID=A0ABX0LGJ7_9NEIS|nr:L-serine ammonia-lyase [Chromobacterium haemolyticum]NHR08058.1 L-serine ammonia-lyase [Chromobacterium haemolyticum]OQS44469.1 L-serine ammonia-lyase [Chromobacterium haemolyticum]